MGHGDYLEIANMQVLKISDGVQDVGADSDFYEDDDFGDDINSHSFL